MSLKTVFKQLNIITFLAKTYVLEELTFWFFAFGRAGKEQLCPHCVVDLKEHRKGKGKNGIVHHIKIEGEGREEVDREGGKGTGPSMDILGPSKGIREEGEEEEGRGKAIFKVRKNGKSWVYENILLETIGTSAFLVKINPFFMNGIKEEGEGEIWEGPDTIVCYIPNILVVFELLNYLLPGRRPLFSSSAEYKPLA